MSVTDKQISEMMMSTIIASRLRVRECRDKEANVARSMVDVIKAHAGERHNQNFATWFNRHGERTDSMSYGKLNERASKLASVIRSRVPEVFLARDQHAALSALIVVRPGFNFIVAFTACLYAGVAAVPVYPPRRGEDGQRISSICVDAGAAVVIADSSIDSVASMLDALSPRPAIVAADECNGSPRFEMYRGEIDLDSIALIQYTSGSTGAPKGVEISHRNLIENQRLIQGAMGHDDSLVVASWLPMFHDMGLIGNLLQPLYVGGRGAYMAAVDFVVRPLRWLQMISEERATTAGGPDFGYRLCLERIGERERRTLDLSSWRVAYNGSEPVSAGTLDAFVAGFSQFGFAAKSFLPCYGMAESTLFVSGVAHDAVTNILTVGRESFSQGRIEGLRSRSLCDGVVPTQKTEPDELEFVSCGEIAGSVDVKIVDPKTRRALPPGRIGEIWVSGPSVGRGYHGQPTLSSDVFAARISEDEGDSCETVYLRTGDSGFFFDDQLYIAGRIKETIIIRGRNFYPRDLESTVSSSIERLAACQLAALSIASDSGEQLGFVVSIRNEKFDQKEIHDLYRSMIEAIARHHDIRLRHVVFTEDRLPTTSSGKLRRHMIRETNFLERKGDGLRLEGMADR